MKEKNKMTNSVPKHVAFIMDGNRRWARQNLLSLLLGHEKGAKQIEPLIEHAVSKGVQYLTFWAFSQENWNRSQEEVKTLMEVFRKMLQSLLFQRLKKKGIQIQCIGDLTTFPPDIQKGVQALITDTKHNDQIVVTFALNYGGRAEILRAINALITEHHEGIIDEKIFSSYLYSKNQPDPDLIIRTGGEQRLSGYLPWQSVYSELYFTKTYWPDFDKKAFNAALEDFSNRQRRFGK